MYIVERLETFKNNRKNKNMKIRSRGHTPQTTLGFTVKISKTFCKNFPKAVTERSKTTQQEGPTSYFYN